MSVHVCVHRLDRKVYDALPVAEERSGGTVWRTITTEECQVVFFPEPEPLVSPSVQSESEDDVPF